MNPGAPSLRLMRRDRSVFHQKITPRTVRRIALVVLPVVGLPVRVIGRRLAALTHAELLAAAGLYADLYRTQFEDQLAEDPSIPW